MRKRITAPGAFLLALITFALGVSLAVFVLPTPVPEGLQAATALTQAPVETQEFTGSKSVSINLTVSPTVPLSVNAEGKVTATALTVGSVVSSGAAALSVNSVPVIALNTSVPLYRDLQQGDKGEDVLALGVELKRLGYDVGEPNKEYGPRMAKAVAALRKASGDTSKDTNLPLSQVLWIPAPDVKVKESSAGLGTLVGPEESVASVGGDLSSLAVVDPSRLSLDVGPMVMEWGDATAPIGPDGTVTDAAFLGAVEGSTDYAAIRASETPTGGTAKVRLEAPISTLRVPPASVFSVRDKQGCVQSLGEAVPVKVVASEMNGTLVTPLDPSGSLPTTVDLGVGIQQGACNV